MPAYIKALDGVTQPIPIIGAIRIAPLPLRRMRARMKNVDANIFPRVLHGYMVQENTVASNQPTRDFSMARAPALRDGLH